MIVCSPVIGIFFLALRARLAALMISTEVTLRPPSNCDTKAEEGEASAGDSADVEDEATDVSEVAVADEEVIVGGVGTSGGQSGGRSSGGTTSAACWGPRLLPGEPLESAKVVVVVVEAVVDVVAAVVVAIVTGVVVAAVVVVFLPTPPILRKSSIEKFNAVGKSDLPLAKNFLDLRVAVVVVMVVANDDAVAGGGLAEVNVGGEKLAEVAGEGVYLADVIAGLDDAVKDASEAAVVGVRLAEVAADLAVEAGRSMIPMRFSLDWGLSSTSSRYSVLRVVSMSCSALAA